MKQSEKSEIIRKFWEGNTSLNEEEELLRGIQPNDADDALNAYVRFVDENKKVTYNREVEIWKNIAEKEHYSRRRIAMFFAIAASILLLVSLFVITFTSFNSKDLNIQFVSNDLKNNYPVLNADSVCERTLYINGCKSSSDCHAVLQSINPECIKHINLINEPAVSGNVEGKIDVWLKGKFDEVFSVCEGTLFFYQDGEIKTIDIEDNCSPNLLVDCREYPLSAIAQMKPNSIKSIEYITDPLNCNGQMNGEFIVVESK